MTAYLLAGRIGPSFSAPEIGIGQIFAAVRGIAPRLRQWVSRSRTGLDHLPRGNAVLVFNHLSYADALLLAAVLPGEPA
jgi:1-acyl-sn-glycerol-3-phosphate acyltransferase